MVFIAPLVGAAVFLSGMVSALPAPQYGSSSSSNSGSNYGSSDSSSSNYGSSGSSSSNYGSSNSGSNYGSSGSSNYGSSGSSNYGSSGSSNYGSGNNYDSSSSTYEQNTQYQNTQYQNTQTEQATSTTTSSNSYSTPSYGSGSSNYWGGSGYEDCVNQCMAEFGGSSMGGSYQATATSGSYGSVGTGATHTVIVAPTQGVFRMVPFATNASVGDTIEFHWGANEHTVTKSSALLPCNKSSEAPVFASGEQNMSFVFTQVVNDTNPTFYYCGTPTHCEKGMFGVINPAMAEPGSPSSLGGMMQSMAANDSDLSAYAAYSSNITASNNAASTWGENFDMSSLPAWSQSLFAANVLYTRNIIGMNADVYTPGTGVDLSSVTSTPLMLPVDITAINNAAPATSAAAANAAGAATPAGAAATEPATSASASAPATTSKASGASALASPRLLVAAGVVLATIFAL